MVERLVTATPPMPVAQPVPLGYTQALTSFLQNEGAIVTHVYSALRSELATPVDLDIANANINQFITSALALGDISLLDHSIVWLNGLLNAYGLSTSLVRQYYVTYRQAVERNLGEDGTIIHDQLARNELSV
jgi:hypothetical protein